MPPKSSELVRISELQRLKKENRATVIASNKQKAEKEVLSSFSHVSSDELYAMTIPKVVELTIGTIEKVEKDIAIPIPTAKDREWALSLNSMTTKKRQDTIYEAVEKKNTWRIAYMVAVFREKDGSLDYFNPNYGYDLFFDAPRSLLSFACHDNPSQNVALLLQCDNIDVNNSYGTDQYLRPLNATLLNKNATAAHNILTMLCKFDLENIYAYIDKAPNKTMRNLMKSALDRRAQKSKENHLELPSPDNEKVITEDNNIWRKMNSKSICKLTTDGGGFRLRKTFNFESSTVQECNEYLDKDGRIITAATPVIIPMHQLISKAEIKQAQTNLKKMNNN